MERGEETIAGECTVTEARHQRSRRGRKRRRRSERGRGCIWGRRGRQRKRKRLVTRDTK